MKNKALMIPGLLALVVSGALGAQTPASPPAKGPTLEERLAARAVENRYAVSYRNGVFSGPGWERLVEEGKKSRFFLVGEEHGVAEIPAVVRELFRTLRPAGYQHLAIEISPPMAAALDETARGADGLRKLSRFFQENPPGVPFFTQREEAELLVAARAAVSGKEPVLWGLDYEVTADRYLLDGVRRRAPEGPAKAAAEKLYQQSAAAWKTVSETKNPAAFFSFATSPDVFKELRQAWPDPDPESARVLDVIEETLAINQMFVTNRNWESNERRAQLNRRNFLRLWNEAKGGQGTPPRVMFKFGASHMIRGRNVTEVFDLGNLAAEMAAAEGSQSFHLLVVGGTGTQHAVFNPMELRYVPAPVDLSEEEGLQPIVAQALPEGFTLIDLRPLRPLLSAARTKTANPELMRIVHGFDAILILTGSAPSQALQ
jgi:hypothetical protein